MAGVDAFGLFKDELKSEDIQDQVNAARRVNTIALGMGEERARGELIPFLRQRVDEYTDEILLVSFNNLCLSYGMKPTIPSAFCFFRCFDG